MGDHQKSSESLNILKKIKTAISRFWIELNPKDSPIANNPDLMFLFIKDNPIHAANLGRKLLADNDFLKKIITEQPDAFKYFHKNTRNNKALAILAIENNADNYISNYQSLNQKLKLDKGVICAMLKKEPYFFASLPKRLRDDRDFVAYIHKKEKLFSHLSERLQHDLGVAKTFLVNNPNLYKHLPESVKNDIFVINLAIRMNLANLVDIPSKSKSDLPTMLHIFKEIKRSYGLRDELLNSIFKNLAPSSILALLDEKETQPFNALLAKHEKVRLKVMGENNSEMDQDKILNECIDRGNKISSTYNVERKRKRM